MRGTDVLVLAALAASLPACRARREDLRGRDREVFFPALRAVWDTRAERGEAEESPRRVGVELDVAYGAGDSEQGVSTGDTVELGDTEFVGPTDVDLDYELTAGSLAGRFGRRIGEGLVLEGIAGVGFASLLLEAEALGVSESERFLTVGPIFGGQITVEPHPRFDLHARGTITLGPGPDPATLTAAEAGFGFRAATRARLFAAWRWWDLNVEGPGSDSDIDLRLSGPSAGLEFRF